MPRFRKTTCWNLRLDDIIRYRSPDGRVEGQVIELAVDPLEHHAVGAVGDRSGRTWPFRFTGKDTVRRRLLGLGEILAELNRSSEPDRPLAGCHVRVARERDALWLHRHGDGYEAKQEKPSEPPFNDLEDAEFACRWVTLRWPEVATLVQPVHRPHARDGEPSLMGHGD